MGKVVRISDQAENTLGKIKDTLILSMTHTSENMDTWKELLIPSDSQVIETSLEQTLKYITEQTTKGENL